MGMIYGAKLARFFHSDNKTNEKYWMLGDYLNPQAWSDTLFSGIIRLAGLQD